VAREKEIKALALIIISSSGIPLSTKELRKTNNSSVSFTKFLKTIIPSIAITIDGLNPL